MKGSDSGQNWFNSFDGNVWGRWSWIRDSHSSVGPALAVLGGRMYAVWKADGAEEAIWWNYFDGSTWTPPVACPAGFATSARPALTTWIHGGEQKLVMAWKGPRMSEQIHFAMFDGTAWGAPAQIPAPVLTSDGPALAVFKGHLYCAWRGGGEDERIWYGSYDGTTWSEPSFLPVPYAGSFGPALVVYRDQLYVAWKGREGDSKIWWTKTSDLPIASTAPVANTTPQPSGYAHPQNPPPAIVAPTPESRVAGNSGSYGQAQPPVPQPAYGQAPAVTPYGQVPHTGSPYGQTAAGTPPHGQPAQTDPSHSQAPATSPYGHSTPAVSPYGHSPPAATPYPQQPATTPSYSQPAQDSTSGQVPPSGPPLTQPPPSTPSAGADTGPPPPGGHRPSTGEEHLEEIKKAVGSGAQYLFGKLKKK